MKSSCMSNRQNKCIFHFLEVVLTKPHGKKIDLCYPFQTFLHLLSLTFVLLFRPKKMSKRVKYMQPELPLVTWQEVGQFAIRSLRDWHTLQQVNQTLKSAMRHPRVLSCFAFTLPDPSFTAKLGAMRAQIRQLRFNNCERTPFDPPMDIPGLPDLSDLPKLEFLDLSGCNMTGINNTVALPSLQTLIVSECDAREVSGLLNWPALTDIT